MIPQSPFGRTGHLSKRIIFGGAAFWSCDQAAADRTLDLLLEHGVNHIDVARNYGDAELRIGPWMKQHRQDFFLATKTQERTYAGAKQQIHESLDRLQTDHLDLIQLHFLVDPAEWEEALGPGGALEALVEARAQGLVRFIGVTGHELVAPAMHLRSLARFDFDSVLLPYNYPLMQNKQYAADFEALMQVCRERNAAVQTIKGMARRLWNHGPRTHTTWYEPLAEQPAVDLATWYVLGQPGIFLNTLGDLQVLPKVLDAASRFERAPSEEAMQALVARLEMTPMFE